MTEQKHIVQLDAIRFFAVLMVMIAHWLQWQWTNVFLTNFQFVHGVTLFFVLSGFLITRILFTNKDQSNSVNSSKSHILKNFFLRRFLRIFPIYYLLIFFLFAINYNNTRDLFPWLVTYTSNIYQLLHNLYVGDFSHFWSLAVEEQFYLFWPFLILFNKRSRIVIYIVISIAIGLFLKAYLFLYTDYWMATNYFILCCIPSLGLGALLSYLTLYKQKIIEVISKPIWIYVMLILYLSMLALHYLIVIEWYKVILNEFVFAILSALIVLRASNNGFKFVSKLLLENKFVVYSGKISYGLYVYHLFIPALFYYLAPKIGLSVNNKYTSFVIFYFLTFLVAHLSWILIEKPLNKLKSKIPYLKTDVKL